MAGHRIREHEQERVVETVQNPSELVSKGSEQTGHNHITITHDIKGQYGECCELFRSVLKLHGTP